MRWIAEVRERLRMLVFRAREEAEMDEELRFHLEMETEKNLRAGMSPEEARRRARLVFGGVEGHREAIRDGRKIPLVEDLWLDLRYARRSLRRSAGFTAVVIATLALGLGTSVAVFSVGRSLVTNAIPFPQPDRLLSVDLAGERGEGLNPRYEDFRVWEEEAGSVVDLAGYTLGPRIVGTGAQAAHAWSLRVTERFFAVLDPRPLLGRTLLPGEDSPVAVISTKLWKELFGSDPGVVGRTLLLGGRPYQVVGVLPAGLEFPAPVDVWVPLSAVGSDAAPGNLQVIGRLQPGVTAVEAQVALETIQRGLDAERPGDERASQVSILPLTGRENELYRSALLLLLSASLFLLLIGMANAAGLMTTRAMQRWREISIRAALGSNRLRIVQQLLVESTLLAVVAGALGILVAQLTLAALRHGVPDTLTRQILGWERLGLDGEALLFALAVSGLTGILFGLGPALGAVRGDLTAALRDGAPTATADRRRSRALRLLLSGQVALALVLLLSAGLLARSLQELVGTDPGFQPAGVIAVEWDLLDDRYGAQASIERFQEPLLQHLRADPGVRSVALTSNLPTTHAWPGVRRAYRIEGGDDGAEPPHAAWRPVTPEYLETVGITLLRGRGFADTDDAGAPRVAIVSEALARRHWPGGADPLGRRLTVEGEEWTVVGVARDVHGFGARSTATIYVPQRQSPTSSGFVVARVAGEPDALATRLRQAIWRLDPDIAVGRVQTMEGVIRDLLADQRIMAYLLGIYASMALLITVISLYALVAHSVVRRRREIGIRVALGARPLRILWVGMGQGLTWVGVGIAAGLLVTTGAARLLAGMLHGVGPLDPLVYTLVPGGMLVLAITASYLPARTAVKVDPVITLRAD